jgi:hypothetical protein
MDIDFARAVVDELQARDVRLLDSDSRANILLFETARGARLALIIKGDNVRYWGLRVPVYEKARAIAGECPGLAVVVVFLAGDEGYVLTQSDVDRARGRWSTDNAGLEYKLNDAELAGFADFRGSAQCAALVEAIVRDIPPCPIPPGIEAFKRPTRRRRRNWLV